MVYGDDKKAVDLATGVRAAVAQSITVVQGSGVDQALPGGIEQAVAAARAADVVLLAIGEIADMSGEAQSRTEIVVPAAQQELAEAVAAVGNPVVVVLKHGRALALKGAVAGAQAILATWFLGTETGNAVADVLFGAYGPSARLPASFPWESGQEPLLLRAQGHGPAEPAGRAAAVQGALRGIPNSARYPFGHGLTYGKIEYSRLSLSSPTMRMTGTIRGVGDASPTAASGPPRRSPSSTSTIA